MLPLVHNGIVRNRSNTFSSSRPHHRSRSTTTLSATNEANMNNNNNSNQYGSKNSSDCKKMKSGIVCMKTNNNRFFKRSLTLGSLFSSSRASRSASTNSLNSSVVEETLAAVLRSSKEILSELDLDRTQSNDYFNNSPICESGSTTSTNTDDNNALIDNLVNNSSTSDLNIDSTTELNSQSNGDLNQPYYSIPPPKYSKTDFKRGRPLLLRSQSAPHHTATGSSDWFQTNSSILENIQEISNPTIEEDEELEMASRRNSYLTHKFNCRLAHDKQIIPIAGFNTKEELYERISTAFKIDIDQILYCTLNSLNIDHLFDRYINFNDLIYVHVRGQAKEIEIVKTDSMLGLTICDNSNGLCLIKKIKEGSVIDKIKFIKIGDIIERINQINLIGYQHIQVANLLKEIQVGELFVIRLIEAIRDEDDESTACQLGKQLKNKIKKGYQTLRIHSKGHQGPPVFEEQDDTNQDVVKKINIIIEDFVGISDSELVQQIIEIGKRCTNSYEFMTSINESDLKVFGFDDDLLLDIWAAFGNRRDD